MTKVEKEKIKHAIQLLHSDEGNGGDYNAGMDILCELAGLPTMRDQLGDMKTISIYDVAKRAGVTDALDKKFGRA